MLLKVAWRNIWRNRHRSLIIIIAVTIGLCTGIFLMAFYNGMVEQRIRLAILNETSHIQMHHPKFPVDQELRYSIPEGYQILQQVRTDPMVNEAAGRLNISGMISSAYGSGGVTIHAIDPSEETRITGLSDKIVQGVYFDSLKRNDILVGEKLMAKLKLKTRNKVILTFQDTRGTVVTTAFRITGVFKTVNTPYDETNVFVPIQSVDELAGMKSQINEIAVLLHSGTTLSTVQSSLREKFPALEIRTWKEIAPEIGLTASVADQMVLIFMGIILLALAFGIVNTMQMAILERRRETGMLLALGMNRPRVFKMVVWETLLLVLAGCPGGILFALTAIKITQQSGIRFRKFADVYASFGYSDVIYPELTLRQFILSMMLVVFTALAASLFPARRALRLNPAEAMRK